MAGKGSVVGRLTVAIGADNTDLQAKMKKTQRRLSIFSRKSKKKIANFVKGSKAKLISLGKSFVKLGAASAAAIAAMGAGFLAYVKNLANSTAQLKNFASANGTTVGEVQKLQYALQSVGSETSAQDVIKDLNDKLGDASITGGGAIADQLKQIGLSANDLQKMKPTQQLESIGKAIQGLPRAQQVNILESISGDASELIPLLENGSKQLKSAGEEAEKYGVTLDKGTASALTRVNKKFVSFTARIKGVAMQLVGNMSPALLAVMGYIEDMIPTTDTMVKWLLKGFKFVVGAVKHVMDFFHALKVVFYGLKYAGTLVAGALVAGFATVAQGAYQMAKGIAIAVKGIADSFNSIPGLPDIPTTGIEKAIGYYADLGKAAGKTRETMISAGDVAQKEFMAALNEPMPSQKINGVLSDLRKRYEEQKKKIAADNAKTTKPKKTTLNRVLGGGSGNTSGSTSATKDKGNPLADRIEKSSNGFVEAQKRQKQAVESVTQALETQDERAKRIYEERIKQIDQNVIDTQKAEMLKKRAHDEYVKSVKNGTNQMSSFAKRASENIQDMLGTGVRKALDGDFRGILSSWTDTLKQMASQALAANIGKKLFGEGVDSGGGLLGKLFGGNKSADQASKTDQGKAAGGLFSNLEGAFTRQSGGFFSSAKTMISEKAGGLFKNIGSAFSRASGGLFAKIGSLFSGGAGGSGGLGSLFSGGGGFAASGGFAVGNLIGSKIAGFLADGGPVQKGKNYVVGDGGTPELFTPGANGYVTPPHRMESNSGSGQVNITIVNQGGDQLQTTGQTRRQNSDGSTDIRLMVKAAMREMSSNGEMDEVMKPYNLSRNQVLT